jgi:hypothetical protein
VRSHLLAGMLDGGLGAADGDAACGGVAMRALSPQHIAGVVWLARSLGVRVGAVQPCGRNLDRAPERQRPRRAVAALRHGRFFPTRREENAVPFHLEPWHDGASLPYYGFGVCGKNQRFLTRDSLVTHNSHSMMGHAVTQSLPPASLLPAEVFLPQLTNPSRFRFRFRAVPVRPSLSGPFIRSPIAQPVRSPSDRRPRVMPRPCDNLPRHFWTKSRTHQPPLISPAANA